MRSTDKDPSLKRNSAERPDWPAMEQRLTKIEDTLITIQTVVNLMHDLLERVIPVDEGYWESGSQGDGE